MDFSLFGFGRFLKNLLMNILRCLFCYETVFLAILLAFAYSIAFWYGRLVVGVGDNCWGWSLDILFSLEAAKNALEEAKGIWTIVPLVLYLITWLIGGGVLLAVFIEKTISFRKEVRAGLFRYKWRLKDHYIILGWDPNCIEWFRDLCDYKKNLNFWDCSSHPRIVILSESDADKIIRCIDAAFPTKLLEKKPFKLLVYHGRYDSPEEFDNLVISQSKEVYILGEPNEAAHDSRVLLLLAHLNEQKIGLDCRAKIESPAFYRSLRKMVERSDEHGLNKLKVRFINFYDNWARRVFDNEDNYYSQFNSFFSENGDKQILIVGFGNMGQSLALRAMRKSVHYYSKIHISAIDKDMDRIKPIFDSSFGDLITRYETTTDITYESCSFESNAFKDFLTEKLETGNKLIVALTLPNPDEALESALQIVKIVKNVNKKTSILLRQNIFNSNVIDCRNIIKDCYNFPEIFCFGFQDGAGFGKKGKKKSSNKSSSNNKTKDNEYSPKGKRNPYIDMLLAYAHTTGNKLVEILKADIKCDYRIDNSIWYDAALINKNEIDLRLLIPDAGKSQEDVRRDIDLLVKRLKNDSTLNGSFIDEDIQNNIWCAKKIVKVPGIPGEPDVLLALNIQAESTYRGIAEVAFKFPQEIKDRYVIAKWMAREKSEKIKEQWVNFIERLIDERGKEVNDEDLKRWLKDNMPPFLK
jgi:hypothetical protein